MRQVIGKTAEVMVAFGSNGNSAGFGSKTDFVTGGEVVNEFSFSDFDQIDRFSFTGFFQEELGLRRRRGRARG